MNLNTNINWSKGLSLGNSSNPYPLSGFNNMKNSNTLSLSNTPQVSLNDFNTPQNSGGKSGGFDLKAGAMAAIPMVTGALGKLNDYTKRNMTDLQKTEFNAIYGRGEDPIFDLFHLGRDAKNTASLIKNTAYTNTGVLGSNQDLLNTYNSFDFDSWKSNDDRIDFFQANLKNLEASGKGASMGSTFGPWGALIGGIIGGVADLGSYIGYRKRGNLINDAKEMTKNLSLASWKEQLNNTNKQINFSNYRKIKLYDMGGALDYGLQNLFALNNYVSALNKSRITSMPNSFLKPQFNSMNYFAVGGMPDFNEFNTGGTHELNPNGGIPQGVDKYGVMNTVELGETKTTTPDGDYIFSDRLKLSKEECKKLGIPKNSTYAEASKILRKEYDEMPNDDIAKRGWEQSRDMLIQSLEMLKQEIALKEARKQGLNSSKMQGVSDLVMQDMYYNENPQEEVLLQQGINPDIPYAFGGLVRKFARGSFLNPNNPGNINQLTSDDIVVTADRVYKPLIQRKVTSVPVSTETIDPYYFKNSPLYAHLYDPDFEGDPEMPDVVMNNLNTVNSHIPFKFMNNYNIPGFTNTSNTNDFSLVGPLPENQMPTYGRGDNVFRYYNSDMGFEGSKIYTNEGYDPAYKDWLNNTLDFGLYFTEDARTQMLNRYNTTKGTNLNWESFNSKLLNLGSDNVYGYYTKMLENAYNLYLKILDASKATENTETPKLETPIETPLEDNFDSSRYKTKNKNYSDYIPLATSILGLLSASLDYSLPNRLYNAINRLPRVSAPRDTNYMTYNPIDINRYLNQYNAQAASTRNAFMNTSNPNRNASLLAAAYNNNIGYGNLAQSLEAQNLKDKMGMQQFNKGVNDSNALYLMQANSINQNYDQMGLNGFIRGLDMENKIQQDYAKAIQGGLQGIADFYNNRATERKGLMTAGLAAVSQGTPFTDDMINYGYNIDPYLGDALFSSRSDYSNYASMQHRNDVVNALKNGTYNPNYLGNLSRYIADPYVADFVRNQYRSNKNFDFKKYGLTQGELDKIIGVG